MTTMKFGFRIKISNVVNQLVAKEEHLDKMGTTSSATVMCQANLRFRRQEESLASSQ